MKLKFDLILHITEDAILFGFGDVETWIPKSLIENVEDMVYLKKPKQRMVEVPEWFAIKEGLEGYECD